MIKAIIISFITKALHHKNIEVKNETKNYSLGYFIMNKDPTAI